MPRKFAARVGIALAVLILLLALNTLAALERVPLLVIALGLALLVTARLRVWLRGKDRAGLAMLPFMAAALVLLIAFCRGRNLPQIVLLLVSIGVVLDILLMALAAIGAVGKRGAKGLCEFGAVAGLGLVMGLALSLVYVAAAIRLGGASLAGPLKP